MNDNNKHRPRHVRGDTITSTLAGCALMKASDGIIDFLVTLTVVILMVILYGVSVGLYRYWRPNLRGCGERLNVGGQWALFCGETPPGHPNAALCKACDPRTGMETI